MTTNTPQKPLAGAASNAALEVLIAQCNQLNPTDTDTLIREMGGRILVACETEAALAGRLGWDAPGSWTLIAAALAHIIRSILATSQEHSPEGARIIATYIHKSIDEGRGD